MSCGRCAIHVGMKTTWSQHCLRVTGHNDIFSATFTNTCNFLMLSFALSVYLFSLSLYWYANIKSNAHDILYFVGLILIDTTQYTLQHTATHYIILQSTAIHYNTLQHTTILHVCFMFWRWLSWPCRFWFRNVSSPCLQTHYIVVKDPHLSD